MATPFNFDLFDRDDEGDKLLKVETVRLQGAGLISGVESLAMSIELLPNLRELSLFLMGEEDFADQFVQKFFKVLY